eukprot:TRINITY_DN513_c0_g1_i2.p1 TRINITY_DN513_c0_g1~~TRINITY_DN513_c0_g1_i2.p1  ORF type:complete len:202 (+),score=29.51 TRINITY_DN513_c0_g1_i2:225-830(+)
MREEEIESEESDKNEPQVPSSGSESEPNHGLRQLLLQLNLQDKEEERTKKRKFESYTPYIRQVLKLIHPELSLSRPAMSIMNSFVNDMFERIAVEAGRIAALKETALTEREIQSAVRLVLNGNLVKFAISEGVKAVTKYELSYGSREKAFQETKVELNRARKSKKFHHKTQVPKSISCSLCTKRFVSAHGLSIHQGRVHNS